MTQRVVWRVPVTAELPSGAQVTPADVRLCADLSHAVVQATRPEGPPRGLVLGSLGASHGLTLTVYDHGGQPASPEAVAEFAAGQLRRVMQDPYAHGATLEIAAAPYTGSLPPSPASAPRPAASSHRPVQATRDQPSR